MQTSADARKPYNRSMHGWWRRDAFYVEYMLHEATALFVAAYAVVLLVGLARLAQGAAAWNAWLQALKSPVAIAFHVLLLIAIGYHAWSWFKIMPRTLPPARIGGTRLSANAITAAGVAAWAITTCLVLALVWRFWA